MPLDLSYLFVSTIDFDEINKMLQASLAKRTNANYPPYNIIKINEILYRISLALAGFTIENVEILLEENLLCIKSIKKNTDDNIEYLHKGIASRSFEKKFQLAENIKVKNAFFKDGLLNIDIMKIEPSGRKVMKIQIINSD